MAVGNLTYYFPRKQQIVEELMDQSFALTRTDGPVTSLAQIDGMLSRMLDTLLRNSFFFLDEAFAGVDEMNIRDMFRLIVEFEFNFMINSQILWGDYDTVPGLAIYQLIRPENARFVSVIRYIWNGKMKIMVNRNEEQGLQ